MNERQMRAMRRFNWIGGGVMLAVYLLLNLMAPEMHVVLKLVVALIAAVIVFALVEGVRRKRRAAEAREEEPKE